MTQTKALTPHQLPHARRMREQGMTLRGVAKHFGVSHQTLANYLKRGVPKERHRLSDSQKSVAKSTRTKRKRIGKELLADGCGVAVILANFPELTESDLL